MKKANDYQEITYGCHNIDEFVDSVVESATYKISGANMVVAGLMSDAQEQLMNNDNEGARKTLNKAKYLLFAVMDGELTGVRERGYLI